MDARKKKFPAGMRVLAVDDDRFCLMVTQLMLKKCEYEVTAVLEPEQALELLRERKGRVDQFELVITDLHMPGMNGIELMEQIKAEMDIPVILLSADDQMEVMINGVQRGSCDYLVKPVHIEQVRSLWMHVVRKCQKCISGGIDNAGEKLRPGVADGENECGKKTRMQSRKKQKMDGLGTEVDKEKDNTSNEKKQRINWSGQLQTRFLAAVHHLGLDRAVPKKIHEMMNVDGLSRESIASHLQKYRLNLKKDLSLRTFIRIPNPFSNQPRWNEWKAIDLNGREICVRKPEIACQGSSLLKDVAVPGSQKDANNQFIITVGQSQVNMSGGRQSFPSGPSSSSVAKSSNCIIDFSLSKSLASGSPGNSFANISSKGSPEQVRSTGLCSYGSVARQMFLEASRGIPVDEDDDAFQSIGDGDILPPANSLLTAQTPQLASQHMVQMQPSSADLSNDRIARETPQVARLKSFTTTSGNTAALPKFDGIGYNKDGPFEGPSQGNNFTSNQLFGHAAAPAGQMPNSGNEFQNQLDAVMNEETIPPRVGFNCPMAPSNLGSNQNSSGMPTDNCAFASANSDIIYALPNGDGTSGNLHANDNTPGLQDVADQLMTNSDGSPMGAISEAQGISGSDFMDFIFDGDFIIDDFNIDGILNLDPSNPTI